MFVFLIIVFLVLFTFSSWLVRRNYDDKHDHSLSETMKALISNILIWITKIFVVLKRRLFPPQYLVINEWAGFLVSKVIYELTKLEIADIIKAQGGKMNVHEISKVTGTNEEKLNRLLRVAASKGIFHYLGNGVYANTRLSLVLCKDHPNTIHNLILLSEEYDSAVQYMTYDLKLQAGNGKEEQMSSFAKAHNGVEAYEWWSLPENKERQEIFNKAMIEQDSIYGNGVFLDYDWSQHSSTKFVDFAGGSGVFLSQLMSQYPKMKGVLYDLPNVIEMSEQLWTTDHKMLLDRIEFFRGDFFINPPPLSDIYFLRSILHNWPDEKAIKILKTIRSAIPSTSINSLSYEANISSFKPKLIIAEILIDDKTQFPLMHQLDILMMIMFGGKERTKLEMKELLNKSGWRLANIIHCRGGFSIIEADPI